MYLLKRFVVLFLFVSCGGFADAQKTYTTHQGFMVIKAHNGDSLKSYRIDNIMVQLDYELATVALSFKLGDSQEDIETSSSFFTDYDAKIICRLSIPKIETHPHPDRQFYTEGELDFKDIVYSVTGDGELRHHDGSGVFSCDLMLRLEVVHGFELVLESIGKVEELHLFQTVLSQRSLEGLSGNEN